MLTKTAKTLSGARKKLYEDIEVISFEGKNTVLIFAGRLKIFKTSLYINI